MEARAMAFYTEDDYYNLPENVRAELIDGQFYYMAASSRIHQRISSELYTTINNYIKASKGSCETYYAPFAVKLFDDSENIVEPDISVICDRNKLTDKGCTGAPDWVVENATPSNAGVREYWIVDPQQQTILVYFFEEDINVRQYTFQDTIKVNIYEDLTIDFSAIHL